MLCPTTNSVWRLPFDVPVRLVMSNRKPVLLGFMGNRGFFPTEFAVEGARATAAVVETLLGGQVEYVDLGNVESYADAKRAAHVAQQHRQGVAGEGAIGVICSMYNFSDENGIR